MRHVQRTLDFSPQRRLSLEAPISAERESVAEKTSEPPPADQGTKTPHLVRPDRQLTYGGAHPWEWPDPKSLQNHDTITVDRIRDDIDGPSHRFVIQRRDRVEVFFSAERVELGRVVGISHARGEVSVKFPGATDGIWFQKGQIYPVVESITKRPRTGLPLSKVIAEVNFKNGSGLTEAGRVPNATPEVTTDQIPCFLTQHPDQEFLSQIGDGGQAIVARPDFAAPRFTALPITETPVALPALAPYTFNDFQTFQHEFSTGSVTLESYREQFERLLASEDSVQAELLFRFKAKELSLLASRMGSGHARRSPKAENAASIVRGMLGSFVLDGSVSYSPYSGETYRDALVKKVRAVTPDEYARALAEREESARKRDRALSNPETLLEFRAFINKFGEEGLSDERLAHYDVLHADMTRAQRANKAPTTVAKFQSDELQTIEFHLKEGFHDKRQCPLWIVQLATRVERDAFNELNRKAKQLSGWYSSFKKSDAGFQFLEKDQADRFCALLNTDADRSDVLEARQERKELTAAERLHKLAEELLKRADETIERSNDSLQNTARRAGVQAGVRGRAFADQALSRTMHSIAEALSRGAAKYLDGIRHKRQVETLDMLLRVAQFSHLRKARHSRDEPGQQPGFADVRYANYPFPTLYRRHLENALLACEGKRGSKQAAARMTKYLRLHGEEYVAFLSSNDVQVLVDLTSRLKRIGHDTEVFGWALEKYDRLQRAGITDLPELRAALREYVAHRAEARGDDPVKTAERQLLGKNLPGFFPTPQPVIERMLALARIEPRHVVLEPSCGKGDILDAIRCQHPDASIHAIEFNRTLADILSAKGYEVEFGDFLAHRGAYDRILMNPPFESQADLEHIRHAFQQLVPGGRLVSVVSESPFFRVDNRSAAFRDWLSEVNAEVEKLPDDAFQGREAFRETGVRTRLVVIDKPTE